MKIPRKIIQTKIFHDFLILNLLLLSQQRLFVFRQNFQRNKVPKKNTSSNFQGVYLLIFKGQKKTNLTFNDKINVFLQQRKTIEIA